MQDLSQLYQAVLERATPNCLKSVTEARRWRRGVDTAGPGHQLYDSGNGRGGGRRFECNDFFVPELLIVVRGP